MLEKIKQTINDYWDSCVQNSGYDIPLDWTNNFYLNRKVCDDGDENMAWADACGYWSGSNWDVGARGFDWLSCSNQGFAVTSYTGK